jgi:superfamily II DNA or RNA helicase
MESLAETLRSKFRQRDQERGEAYCYDLDAVRNCEIRGNTVTATVFGSSRYDVQMDFVRGSGFLRFKEFFCECPHFSKGNNCKHLWALILECDYRCDEDDVWKKFFARHSKPDQSRIQTAIASLDRYSPVDYKPPHQDLLFSKASETRLSYVFDLGGSEDCLRLDVIGQAKLASGQWGKPKPYTYTRASIESAPPTSQQLLRSLTGYHIPPDDQHYVYHYDTSEEYGSFEVSSAWSSDILNQLAASGRLFWSFDSCSSIDEWVPVEVDLELPYRINIVYDESKVTKTKVLLDISNGRQSIPTDQLLIVQPNAVSLAKTGLFRIENPELMPMLNLVLAGELVVRKKDRSDFIELIDRLPNADQIPLPKSWEIDQQQVKPLAGVEFHQNGNSKFIFARVFFEYGSETFSWGTNEQTKFDAKQKSILVRSFRQEEVLLQQLIDIQVPLKPVVDSDASFQLKSSDFVHVSSTLATLGWKVLWKGKPLRVATGLTSSVSSEQDWFNLDAKVDFNGTQIPLPQILSAMKSKERYVTLHDGTLGHIPAGLLDRYAQIAQFGEVQDDVFRFKPSQAMILDVMLESQENVEIDRRFEDYRKKIRSFDGVKPIKPTAGFKGELRSYQADGLGWLHFLQEFNLGGCLADDMGLGKTVQVLALLEKRRTRRLTKISSSTARTKAVKGAKKGTVKDELIESMPGSELAEALRGSAEIDPWCEEVNSFKRKPTIVVVPKSLIFNWRDEASKFSPKLRILNYTGSDRKTVAAAAGEFDVLLTTYATMRIDIQKLCQIQFDYAILDESQAIKNSNSLVAKASRLLRSDHRLAMTGTPIENHLGELWSLFEFLNPGMLGSSLGFKALTRVKPNDPNDKRAVQALAAGLKPFFLRRTKSQVLKDLPEKTEQLLTCEMTKPQQKQYNELKEYYRIKLKKKVETEGLGKSKIYVLEALLRLRQVACDPRLLDPKAKPGAKLELLGQQLEEVIGGGSKALVFSQFTSLLSLVKEQLDDAGIVYEYLDGQTTKRAAKVKSFQENDDIKVFLISLKAGGSGLNLTAAQYVYLLDPWWNPAVEAQAIDRAHRMGQSDPVFAYRMTCKDTVEDKILKMQASKKLLAESVINADDSLLRNLSSDDLALLLG